jgi:hypothetical protein
VAKPEERFAFLNNCLAFHFIDFVFQSAITRRHYSDSVRRRWILEIGSFAYHAERGCGCFQHLHYSESLRSCEVAPNVLSRLWVKFHLNYSNNCRKKNGGNNPTFNRYSCQMLTKDEDFEVVLEIEQTSLFSLPE